MVYVHKCVCVYLYELADELHRVVVRLCQQGSTDDLAVMKSLGTEPSLSKATCINELEHLVGRTHTHADIYKKVQKSSSV